jgi:hypothetical protein
VAILALAKVNTPEEFGFVSVHLAYYSLDVIKECCIRYQLRYLNDDDRSGRFTDGRLTMLCFRLPFHGQIP